MDHDYSITIAELRQEALKYLAKNNFNVFLVDEYLDKDLEENMGLEQYDLCRNILFDSICKENLFFLSANQDVSWFQCIEDQLYQLLTCKRDYKTDNFYALMFWGGVASELTDFFTATFGINPTIAHGMAYLLCYTVLKLGIKAWCKRYEAKKKHDQE